MKYNSTFNASTCIKMRNYFSSTVENVVYHFTVALRWWNSLYFWSVWSAVG